MPPTKFNDQPLRLYTHHLVRAIAATMWVSVTAKLGWQSPPGHGSLPVIHLVTIIILLIVLLFLRLSILDCFRALIQTIPQAHPHATPFWPGRNALPTASALRGDWSRCERRRRDP